MLWFLGFMHELHPSSDESSIPSISIYMHAYHIFAYLMPTRRRMFVIDEKPRLQIVKCLSERCISTSSWVACDQLVNAILNHSFIKRLFVYVYIVFLRKWLDYKKEVPCICVQILNELWNYFPQCKSQWEISHSCFSLRCLYYFFRF